MLNQVVLVGRLVNDVELKELESGKKVANVTLAVSRSYKNAEGVYDTDFINCVLWSNIAESAAEYCRKGDIVGVKGRVETREVELEDGENRTITEIIVDKVSFLTSSKREDD